MKKVMFSNILVLLIIFSIFIPNFSYTATTFKKGDKVEFKQASTAYIKKEEGLQSRLTLEKANKDFAKGDVVTYKSKLTPGAWETNSNQPSAEELSMITSKGKEYIVKTADLKKSNSEKEDDKPLDYGETGSETAINDAKEKEEEEKENPIFYQPSKVTSGDSSEQDLDDLITDAESFIEDGDGEEVIDTGTLQNFSRTLYNILLAVGVVAAVIVGALLGIKLMTASVEEKAEVKKLIMPYVVGCIVIFGGFTIWKVLVEILSNV